MENILNYEGSCTFTQKLVNFGPQTDKTNSNSLWRMTRRRPSDSNYHALL